MHTSTAWTLHDVNDVEALVRKRLNTLTAFSTLSWSDQEDAVSEMLEAVIKLEQAWKGESTFSHFVWATLPNKLTDYLRRYHVDLRNPYEAQAVVTLSDDMSLFDDMIWDEDEEEPPSMTHLLDGLDIDSLSEEARQILFDFAIPLACGQDIDNLAFLHGITDRTIRERLTYLADRCDPDRMEDHRSWVNDRLTEWLANADD